MFLSSQGQYASSRQISWRSVKPLPRYRNFQAGGRPPSWICYARWDHPRRAFAGFYHSAKRDGIHVVVSIIIMFLDFASLAWKCLFSLRRRNFGRFDPINGEAINQKAERHHIASGATCARVFLWSYRPDRQTETGIMRPCVSGRIVRVLRTANWEACDWSASQQQQLQVDRQQITDA